MRFAQAEQRIPCQRNERGKRNFKFKLFMQQCPLKESGILVHHLHKTTIIQILLPLRNNNIRRLQTTDNLHLAC